MTFIRHDITTSFRKRITNVPAIYFHPDGTIRFNRLLVEQLNLTNEKKVVFLQDPFNRKKWFFTFDIPEKGMSIRQTASGRLCINCKQIADKISAWGTRSLLINAQPIVIEGIKAYEIIIP